MKSFRMKLMLNEHKEGNLLIKGDVVELISSLVKRLLKKLIAIFFKVYGLLHHCHHPSKIQFYFSSCA